MAVSLRRAPWLLLWLGLFMVVGVMSVTAPRNAGPDEPAHLIRAAGVARGQLLGESLEDSEFAEHPSGAAGRVFDVPSWVSEPDVSCFAFQPDVPAGCASVRPTADGDVAQVSTAASYPPWPHLVAGLPTLLPGGAELQYVSRLLTGLLLTLVLAWAFAWRARRSGWTGLLPLTLAMSPAALWIVSVNNPSAYAVVGAVALVASLPELTQGETSAAPLALTGTALLLLSRNDGVVWWAVVVGLAALVWGRDMVAARRAFNGVTAGVLVAVAVLALSWFAVERPQLVHIPTEERGWDLLALVLNRTSVHLDEAVGLVSWADTRVTDLTMYAWWALVAASAAIAWLSGRVRGVRAFAVALVVFVGSAWLADFVGARSVGLVWQGRYALPALMAGVALLGMSRGDETAGRRAAVPAAQLWRVDRMSAWLLLCNAVVLVAAAWQMFRRWSVGATGSPFPWDWQRGASAVHPAVSLLVYVAGLTMIAFSLRALVRQENSSMTSVTSR